MSPPAHPIPEAALAAHLAILGMTGAGKSYAARSTVERILAAGERACIIDPTGVWWGLRLAADGQRASPFPVAVVGGRRGDLALDPDSGAALAGVIGRSSTPLILDVSGHTTAERTRFFTAFAEGVLIHNVGPLHLVLDEAHLFAPQGRLPDPASARMLHATNNLVALGRARGLRITLISQRAAKLHKDSLTQVSTLVAMKLVAPQDRKAVEAWIGDQGDRDLGAQVLRTLPELPTGEGWVWAPAQGVLERAAFPRIATYDSMAAPVSAGEATGLPPIDLEAIRAALSAATVPADREERRASRPAGARDLAEAEQRGYERGYATGARHAATETRMAVGHIGAALAALEKRLAEPSFYRDDSFGDQPSEAPAVPAPIVPPSAPVRERLPAERMIAEQDTAGLNSAGRKMLAVLDTNPPVRRSWHQVATLAGIKARGGHYNAGRRGLLDQAWVEEQGDLVVIRKPKAFAPPPVTNTVALVEMWAAVLHGAAPRILTHLAGAGPGSREQIGDALGLQTRGGHWNAALKQLRDNDLIQERDGVFRLSRLFNGGTRG